MSAKFLSALALLVVAQLASNANAATVEVPDWVVPYNGAQEWQASVGDTMVFEWTGGHNVFIHPTLDCNLDGRTFIGSETGTSYTFAEEDGSPEGTLMFFACDIGQGSHCRFGQSLTVMVYSGEAPGGSGVVPDEPVVLPEPEPEPPIEEEPVVLPEPEPENPIEEEPVVLPEPETTSETDMGSAEADSAGALNSVSVASLFGLVAAVVALAL